MANKKQTPPMVSVIVPTHNRPEMLVLCLESILKQTYRDFEIIVVNDAGVDVADPISSLNHENRISYIKHIRNEGLAAARNTGIKQARGKYIAYLDDDDLYYPEHLETLISLLENSDFKVAYTDAHRELQVKENGAYITKGKDLPYSYDFDPDLILVTNFIPVLCFMHEKSCLDAVGLFDESLPVLEDWDLWIRVSRQFPLAHIKKITAAYSCRADGSTMTGAGQVEFLNTEKRIYEKYRAYALNNPAVLERQEKALAIRREKIAQMTPEPLVSIVLPVHNNLQQVKQCLGSISTNTDYAPFEVIVVDNGSTDGTSEFLHDCLGGDVRIISNTCDVGFDRACSQGAEKANGDYLVLMSADTVVQKGWLTKRLRSSKTPTPQSKKILVVSPVCGGSLPIARYCASALEQMGHGVELIDNSCYAETLFSIKEITKDPIRVGQLTNQFAAFLSEATLARCEEFEPDLLFALAQAPLTADCLKQLRNTGTLTAFWFVEDFRFMDYWQNTAPLYDHFFTIQQEPFFSELEKRGVHHHHYLPLAACPEIHKPMELSEEDRATYGSDLSFVGAGYFNRKQFFPHLLDYEFKIWGSDWDLAPPLLPHIQRSAERIDSEETVRIFNAARINLNLHSSPTHAGINPNGDFLNPRTFEIAACGGFQLVDRRSGLEGLFTPGEEMIVFDDLQDLRRKIAHYLHHPEERLLLTERARQKVLTAHTYTHRMTEMLDRVTDRHTSKPDKIKIIPSKKLIPNL